ncbi:MAG: DUF3467 domain-containing protein [Actinobacteria bacterium]|nr:DUF3467 domain-containing protein [Actinomycetota bacterium]
MSEEADKPSEGGGEIFIDAQQMAGTWANFARVSHSPHEFTLDFVRMDYAASPTNGIVVARVSVSPLFITQLIEALSDNWDNYAKLAMPKEVYGDESDDSAAGEENAEPA